MFPAHIRQDNEEQIVENHLRETAELAEKACTSVGLSRTAYLIGILHDMGKFTNKFKMYLKKAANGEKVIRGSVNHTFCAVIYLFEQYWQKTDDKNSRITVEILAYAIGSHHGLFDIVNNKNNENGFSHRLKKDKSELCYNEAVQNFLQVFPQTLIDELFSEAVSEIISFMSQFSGAKSFLRGLLVRLLLSAVIYADRRNTEEFMQNTSLEMPEVNWKDELEYFNRNLANLPCDTAINQVRHTFSDMCANFAQSHNDGIYRLTLPTGAGKTLSSLRFGLTNAEKFGKKRIFFVIPLLSVIEQNAKVIREAVQNKNIITEHHSNVVYETNMPDEYDISESLTESWNYPIVITTLVQLLQTLFSDNTSCVRRMQALCGSVLIIDEVQSLPVKTMYLFCQAMRFLAQFCGVTIVLSSATQPQFQMFDKKYAMPIDNDIIPYDEALFSVFKRTEIVDKTTPYGWNMEELSDFSRKISENAKSLLIICNTKASSLNLYNYLVDKRADYNLFYLSAAMCAKHREDTVNKIKKMLDSDKKVICVSTQVVEAGIDFSFEHVIRVLAGADNIVQAAGRCNRNGEFSGTREVYIVNLKCDCENLSMLPEIQNAQNCTQNVLYNKEISIDSMEGIELYYKNYYSPQSDISNKFGYPVKIDGLQTELFSMFGVNKILRKNSKENDKYCLKFSFKTAGSNFSVFAEDTTDVIVEYDDLSQQLIADLCSQQGIENIKQTLKNAKPYIIHLYAYQKEKLEKNGMIYFAYNGRIPILQKQCYNEKFGLNPEGNGENCLCL